MRLLHNQKQKVIVIDARDHILGRLAAIVAKELLEGQKVIVTRCEGMVVTGTLLRKKQAFLRYLNKVCTCLYMHTCTCIVNTL